MPHPQDFDRIRVHEHEALLHERLLVIQGHAVQVDERFRIDEDSHIAKLEDAVTLARLRVEANVVAQPGASAALHAKTQSALLGRDAFFHDGGADSAPELYPLPGRL